MEIAVSDAETRLSDLVIQAGEGDDVVLTLTGHFPVRLVPIVPEKPPISECDLEALRAKRRTIMQEVRASVAGKAKPGVSAARSQDFLYDENGLPG